MNCFMEKNKSQYILGLINLEASSLGQSTELKLTLAR